MQFSLDSYRILARVAGIAHKTKDAATAKATFKTLWERLDRETLDDHCDAREAFNVAFARAYRGQDAAPALAPTATAALYDYLHPKIKSERTAPAPRKSVALDCAAFFAKQGA